MTIFVEDIIPKSNSIQSIFTDHLSYYNTDDAKPMDGVIRTNRGNLEYYNSDTGWCLLSAQQLKIEIAPHYQMLLDWAMNKMLKEKKEEILTKKYPAFKTAKENYETVKAIVENEQNTL
jgi:hypothetical protein